jgi:hypothetical protein
MRHPTVVEEESKAKRSIVTNSTAISRVHEFLCAAFIADAPVFQHFMRSNNFPEGLFPRVKGELGNHHGIISDRTLNAFKTLFQV